MESVSNLPEKVTNIVQEAADYYVSKNTWRSYNTAKEHIKEAEKWSNMKMEIPFTQDMTLACIAYLRGKPKTCKADWFKFDYSQMENRNFNLDRSGWFSVDRFVVCLLLSNGK